MPFNFDGLSEQAVTDSRNLYGSNAVATQASETFWEKLFSNFKDPIIVILLIALAITLLLATLGYAEWYEGVGIAIAVILATFIATWSEHSNEGRFRQLLEESSRIQVKVFRQKGHLVQLPIDELVVGDYIFLQAGDTIPTDGVLVEGHIEVDEAALTGESETIHKQAHHADKELITVFRAGLIVDGEAVMCATAVGNQTLYGKTMSELGIAVDSLSPLQEKLSILGKQIAHVAYFGAGFIFLAFMLNQIFLEQDGFSAYFQQPLGIIFHNIFTALILAIIVIVVAVPEGLPMMIAIVLAINMKKLLAVKVLVRKLLGIETAGSLTVLFTDKTGTLTQGRLVVETVLLGQGETFQHFTEIPNRLGKMFGFALRNNTSAVIDARHPEQPTMVGADRTEQALLRFILTELVHKDELTVIARIPFNSSRKFSAVQVESPIVSLTLIKGAPDILLAQCTDCLDKEGNPMAFTDKTLLQDAMHQLSARAMRLLAVAVTTEPIHADKTLPARLTLLGVFGLRDALRDTSYQAVKTAKQAGIQVVMITGDAKETAQAIARDVGLLEDDPQALILTSTELQALSDVELAERLPHLRVVSRAFPTDKSRLVRVAKSLHWVVGMTGDGVNDAPAVKSADVGFAMGSGTEMTKESSDIVVLDDNFVSITKAVLYGRTLFKSIRKFLVFQLTVSLSAVLVAFFAPFVGFELPLTMTQLLWLNIIMDTFAGLALAGEAALNRYMLEPPIPKNEPMINGDMAMSIVINGVVATIISIWFLTSPITKGLFTGGYAIDSVEARAVFLSAFFAFFVFLQVFNTFNARTQGLNLFENISNNAFFLPIIGFIFGIQVIMVQFGGEIMRTVGLNTTEWLYVLLFSIILIPVDLCRKFLRNQLGKNPVIQSFRGEDF
ncbi:calcium-translocating P-type ATPase, PMCA-type [Beggiatoa leptomitoformis]|uniref:P-type Ca(2+) transporter n=1 Tax=Beggiatoa leptomitoformis TaxID=288004 RepID=A0A2N9YFB2_9GAMM|nr:calcium-translocating P-type ATPase, PMCA-type [Beggiatoa leptomitoformis]ALG68456.1 calcium-translocating P-type ATPase, PMCA-type [Beggiatoa leptomitoformis]AUI69211.1 calcium-translocating P-type ATPase, PMCA-type [Beggiatoa leptomitoformis]